MPRGRKPLPTDFKIIRGNPGKRSLKAEDEPQPTPGAPEPPEHLGDEAKKQWYRMVPELAKMRVLTLADREVLALFCDAWERYLLAQAAVKKHGLLVKSPSGYPIQNPALSIRNQAAKELRSLAAEFGLTPAARTRVRTNTPNQPDLPGFTNPANPTPTAPTNPLDVVRMLAANSA